MCSCSTHGAIDMSIFALNILLIFMYWNFRSVMLMLVKFWYIQRAFQCYFFHLLTNTKILTSHKSSSSRYTYIQDRPHIFINNRVELPQRDTWRQEMKRDLLQVNIHISYIYVVGRWTFKSLIMIYFNMTNTANDNFFSSV